MRKKILILGSSGFLGNKIKNELKTKYKFYLSHNRKKRKNFLKNKKLFENYIKKNQIEVIINLIREKNLRNCKAVNSLIIKIAKKCNCKVIYISSCLIYGKNKHICNEKTKVRPYDKYTKIKHFAEMLFLNSNINYKILRLSNVYDNDFKKKGLIKNLHLSLFNRLEHIYINDLKIYRNFIHYADFLKTLKILIDNFENIKPAIINCGNENIKIFDLVKVMSKIYERKPKIVKKNNNFFDPSIKISNRLNNSIFKINNKIYLFKHLKKIYYEKYF